MISVKRSTTLYQSFFDIRKPVLLGKSRLICSHFNAKSVAARKVFLLLSCPCASWGLDRKRIKFLYLTASIEPILLYGCSVWAQLLNSKAVIKKARSSQRISQPQLHGAFKTVLTEALLFLNAAIPIELRVAEIPSAGFRASLNEFSSASLKWLYKFFPCVVTQNRIHPASHLTASTCQKT
jgi:hypothetical protein